jgi:hypothetical protein
MLEWVIQAYHCVSRGSQALVGMYRPTRELMYEHVSTWNIMPRHTYRCVTHLHS